MNISKQDEQLTEQLSALVDDECETQALSVFLSMSNFEENKNNWEIYHQIGDILNSYDLSILMSTGFTARMSDQLASEPTYIKAKQKFSNRFNHKIAYAAAAMLAFATILVPRFAGHDGAEIAAPYFAGQFIATSGGAPLKSSALVSTATKKTNSNQTAGNYAETQPRMLRDPAIDSYLAAHQRYSKSMYSAVEYETGPINQEVEK